MTGVVFRGESVNEPNVSQEQEKASNEPTTQRDSEVEPAFTIYESAKNKNPIGEYYGIEVNGKTSDGEGTDYYSDFKAIEKYFREKIERGEIENTQEAVKLLLKKYEKTLEIEKSERLVVKIQKMLAYIKFKEEVDKILADNLKYGRT
jgi:hypothetical protein